MPSSHGLFNSSIFKPSRLRDSSDVTTTSSDNQSDFTAESNSSPPRAPLTSSSSAASSLHQRESHRRSFSRSSQIAFPTTLRRSISLRSGLRSSTESSNPSPPRRAPSTSRLPSFGLRRQKSSDTFHNHPISSTSTFDHSKLPTATMAAAVSYRSGQSVRAPGTASGNVPFGQGNGTLGPAAQIGGAGGQNPQAVFQHIQDAASKRISTLDYLRKSYD